MLGYLFPDSLCLVLGNLRYRLVKTFIKYNT